MFCISLINLRNYCVIRRSLKCSDKWPDILKFPPKYWCSGWCMTMLDFWIQDRHPRLWGYLVKKRQQNFFLNAWSIIPINYRDWQIYVSFLLNLVPRALFLGFGGGAGKAMEMRPEDEVASFWQFAINTSARECFCCCCFSLLFPFCSP